MSAPTIGQPHHSWPTHTPNKEALPPTQSTNWIIEQMDQMNYNEAGSPMEGSREDSHMSQKCAVTGIFLRYLTFCASA